MLDKLLGNINYKISSLLIVVVIVFSFQGIQNIFFQQDEWLGLGGAISRHETYGNLGNILQVFNFQGSNEVVRFLPVTSIINYLVYNYFGLNTAAYGISSLIIVIIC